jgi:hypothetical protein
MDREDIILCIANNNRTIDTNRGFIVFERYYTASIKTVLKTPRPNKLQ